MQRHSILLCLSLALTTPTLARDVSKWTIDDIVVTQQAHDFQISPDGKWAVWVKTVMDKDEGKRISHLYRTDLVKNRTVRLTRGKESCTHPRWSPSGEKLAFLSKRPAKEGDKKTTQIWIMDAFGGEPWVLTETKRGVNDFGWAGDDAIVFLAKEAATLREQTLVEDKKDQTTIVEDDANEPPVRLFRITLADKNVVRISTNDDPIAMLSVSPDGKRAVTSHSQSLRFTFDNRTKPKVFLYDLTTGKAKHIFRDRKYNISAALWQPDSRAFYAINETNSQPHLVEAGINEVYHFPLETGEESKLDLEWPNGVSLQFENRYAPGLLPTVDGFFALLANGARNKVARYTKSDNGFERTWLTGEHASNIFGWQVSLDGKRLLYSYSTPEIPSQWYEAEVDGAKLTTPRAITKLTPHLAKKTFAKAEVIRWKGAEDDEVEGLLYYPIGYKPGKKHPLVVMIHGGPASLDLDSWDDSWAYAANLYCQRGAFVLKPNYHGSSHYGLKWLESITGGKYGQLETIDIENGVDHLLAKGLVDPDKLGLLGWSNGAILTNILLTQTTRYKAAASGAGNIEYISDWANCEFGDAFDRFYLGKSPLEDPQLYQKRSPFYRLDKVTTPTLIFFGENDRVVPTSQGWMHYRALQQLGKTDVRFVLFPDEEHSLQRLAHQRRKLEEELAWFDKYLFETTPEEPRAYKADSPLASLLARQRAKRTEQGMGLLDKQILIPETVPYKGLHVGRFEVTRAQYAQFDKTIELPDWRINYPMTGISFDRAQAYCAWLSQTTGRTYRLPTVEEAKRLYPTDSTGENTLDHWVGYAINPDDAKRVREQLRERRRGQVLLRGVGNFRGLGDTEWVFDLGGNAAEWCVHADGKGVLRGGSADRPSQPQTLNRQAGVNFRGFRVIREP